MNTNTPDQPRAAAPPEAPSSVPQGGPEKKVLCVEVTRPDSKGRSDKCIWRYDKFTVDLEFDGAEVGDSITLTLAEMTEAELEELPEFEGW